MTEMEMKMEMENVNVRPSFPLVYLRPNRDCVENAVFELTHYANGVEQEIRENYEEFSPMDIQAFRNAKTGAVILKILIANGPTVEFTVTVSEGENTEIEGEYWSYPGISRADFSGEMPAFAMWCEEYAEDL